MSEFSIFLNGWMNCRDAFDVVLCLYCLVMDRTWLCTKRLMSFPIGPERMFILSIRTFYENHY